MNLQQHWSGRFHATHGDWHLAAAWSGSNTGTAENRRSTGVNCSSAVDSIKTIHLNRKRSLFVASLFTVVLMAHLSSNQYGQNVSLSSELLLCSHPEPNERRDPSLEQVGTWQIINWPCRFLPRPKHRFLLTHASHGWAVAVWLG